MVSVTGECEPAVTAGIRFGGGKSRKFAGVVCRKDYPSKLKRTSYKNNVKPAILV